MPSGSGLVSCSNNSSPHLRHLFQSLCSNSLSKRHLRVLISIGTGRRGKTFFTTAILSAWALLPWMLSPNFLTHVQYGGSQLNQPTSLATPSDTIVSQKVQGRPLMLPSTAALKHEGHRDPSRMSSPPYHPATWSPVELPPMTGTGEKPVTEKPLQKLLDERCADLPAKETWLPVWTTRGRKEAPFPMWWGQLVNPRAPTSSHFYEKILSSGLQWGNGSQAYPSGPAHPHPARQRPGGEMLRVYPLQSQPAPSSPTIKKFLS